MLPNARGWECSSNRGPSSESSLASRPMLVQGCFSPYGLKQPWTSIGLDASELSLDGPLFEEHSHPRAFGSMPRFLGHYVRDEHLLPLEQAIRKITSLPAQRERL